jgi:polysaccharide biosynthesis/export protein
VPASAVPAAAAPAPEKDDRLIDRQHHLGPGDQVAIRVQGLTEFDREVVLLKDGTFDYGLLGTIEAAGLTTAELAGRLAEGLKKYVRRPRVEVSLKQAYVPPRPEVASVLVLGAVTRRGPLALPMPRPLRALLADAAPTDRADLANIRVRYPDGSARTADFSGFALTGEAKEDVLLKGGEEVIVLEKPAVQKPDPVHVTVLGAVVRPGSLDIEGDASILDVLQKAGGAQPSANLERVEVTGPSHASPRLLDVGRYMAGDRSAGYQAKTGDVIVVPVLPLKIYVLGEVTKPGELAIKENQKLLDLYLQSGGAGPNGDIRRARIIRRGPDGKPTSQKIDLDALMRGKEKAAPTLVAGDVLYIPHRQKKRSLLDYVAAFASPLYLLRQASGLGY